MAALAPRYRSYPRHGTDRDLTIVLAAITSWYWPCSIHSKIVSESPPHHSVGHTLITKVMLPSLSPDFALSASLYKSIYWSYLYRIVRCVEPSLPSHR